MSLSANFLQVNIIEGRRGSACNNDAFSVVAYGKDLVDIIPASEVPGKSADDVLDAYRRAATATGSREEVKQVYLHRVRVNGHHDDSAADSRQIGHGECGSLRT